MQLVVGHHLVAVDVDFVNLHLVVTVDNDVDDHFVLVAEVFVQVDADVGISEAFLRVVLFNDLLGAVYDVLRNLVAFHELEAFLDVVAFAFFHAEIVYLGDSGAECGGRFRATLGRRRFFRL